MRRAPRRIVHLPLLLATLAACDEGGAPAAEASVRDSAGITIVENAEAGEGWTVAAEPDVDIGVLEGEAEYQLFNVRGAVRLSDGRIVVANAGTHELRFYDERGRHLLSAGRKGGGPGEFEQMAGPWLLPGDSLLLHDWRESRMSVFSPEGSFARSFRLETGEGITFPSPLAASGDRLLVQSGQVFMAGEAKTGVARDSTNVLVYDMTGALQDTVVALPGSEAYVKASGTSMSVRPLPFGRGLEVASAGGRLLGGPTERPELGVWTLDGALVRLVRWTQPPRPVTPQDVEEFKTRERERLEEESSLPESFRTMQLAALDEIPYPQVFPAYEDVLIDKLDHVWVRRASAPGVTGRDWLVFDPEGRLLASVEMPEGLVVRQIGADWVLGTWEDDFEVEHVRLHGLERAPRTG